MRIRIPFSGRWIAVSLLVCSACGTGGTPSAEPEISETAGVRVVINAPPESAPLWRLDASPTVEIGTGGSDRSDVLYRVEGAVVLSDGTIVVANEGTGELRYYTPQAQLIAASGGRGQGPGEFGYIRMGGLLEGDSVVARDLQRFIAQVFDRRGQFVRAEPLPRPDGRIPLYGPVLRTGRTLINFRSDPPVEDRSAATPVRRGRRTIALAGPGSDILPLGDYLSAITACEGPEDSRTCSTAPFTPDLFWTASSDRIAVATSDSFHINVHDETGTLLHVVRQRRDPREVQPGDFERVADTVSREFPSPEMRRVYERLPHLAFYPAFSGLLIDQTGRLWVREARAAGDDVVAWQVFDRDGMLIGRVEPPADLQVTSIGSDFVVGVAKDDLGVERVRVYRFHPALKRPASE